MMRPRMSVAPRARRRAQGGLFLIEAMLAILIFALGILGMIAMGGAAVSAQSDAQYRTEAQGHAEAIAAAIALRADRSAGDTALSNSLVLYRHQTTGTDCNFGGAPTADVEVLALTQRVANQTPGLTGLPGSGLQHQQVNVDVDPVAGHNRVTITLCWKAPSDTATRQHTLVTYVNGTKDS